MHLPDLFPQPPDWRVRWDEFDAAFEWIRRLRDCPQDPDYHAEGNVWIHARMVCEALAEDPEWRALPPQDRDTVFCAALMHDIAKPDCTRQENGRIRSPGHAARGAIQSRGLLWEMDWPVWRREQVAALVRHHMKPYWLPEEDGAARQIHFMSQSARCDWLALLSFADVRGRICADRQRLLDNVARFRDMAAAENCLASPRQFANDHSRFLYFREPNRDPNHAAAEDCRCQVTLLCGLPGAGKDTWLASPHAPSHAVISIDALREQIELDTAAAGGAQPAPDSEAVLQAREQARRHLSAGESFVWNASNLSRQIRSQVIDLAAGSGARVHIVAIEVPAAELWRRNGERGRPIPETIIRRMLARWEMPDLTEAHQVMALLAD